MKVSETIKQVIVTKAATRPEKLSQPFTRWNVRRLAAYLAGPGTAISRERLPQILCQHGTSFQRTRTWKQSGGLDKNARLDQIEHVTRSFPDRCFAYDQFGPLSIRPCHGSSWSPPPATPASWPPSARNAPASAPSGRALGRPETKSHMIRPGGRFGSAH